MSNGNSPSHAALVERLFGRLTTTYRTHMHIVRDRRLDHADRLRFLDAWPCMDDFERGEVARLKDEIRDQMVADALAAEDHQAEMAAAAETAALATMRPAAPDGPLVERPADLVAAVDALRGPHDGRSLSPGQCAYCDKHRSDSMMPGHTPSQYCRSGKHPHCTCDTCF